MLFCNGRPRNIADALHAVPGSQPGDSFSYRLFDLGGKADVNAITAMQRLLEAIGIHDIPGNHFERVVKYYVSLLKIAGHDPYLEPGFFQSIRDGFP